jgi:hypothetical protein
MDDAQTQNLGLAIDALGMHKKTQHFFVSGQHRDVSGHQQTHLGWAIGQSGKKEADNKDPLLIYRPPQVTIYLHLYNWFLR